METNGTFAIPKRASPAASLSEPGPPYLRTRRYAHATIQPMRLDVSRTSHCHQTPHAFRAHSGPVTRTMAPKRTVSSAAAYARRSCRGDPPKRNLALAIPHTIAERRNTHADGRWK